VPKLRPINRAYLTMPEIKKLQEAAYWYPREHALLELMLVTALRPSELFALRWKCFDFDARVLTIKETVYRGKLRPYTKTTEQGGHGSSDGVRAGSCCDNAHIAEHEPRNGSHRSLDVLNAVTR
jgi:hypothetical protein